MAGAQVDVGQHPTLVAPQYVPASAVAVKPVARAAIAARKLLMDALLGKFIKRKFII